MLVWESSMGLVERADTEWRVTEMGCAGVVFGFREKAGMNEAIFGLPKTYIRFRSAPVGWRKRDYGAK